MTPQERGRLDAVLQHYSARYVNWLVDHVEKDYKEITGGNKMNCKQAEKLAIESLEGLTEEGTDVADTTCIFLQANGKYTVTDNGEEVTDLNRENAIRVIVENLTASK